MNPDFTDPDIVPIHDGADCSSEILWRRVGYGDETTDALYNWPWDVPDTLDTGSPE